MPVINILFSLICGVTWSDTARRRVAWLKCGNPMKMNTNQGKSLKFSRPLYLTSARISVNIFVDITSLLTYQSA